REVDLDAAPGRGHDPTAGPQVEPVRREPRQFAVHAELETFGIRDAAQVRLEGDPMLSYASGHGRVEAHAGREPGVGIGEGGCRGDGSLARLDFQAIGIAQGDELARTLEVVVDSVDGRVVRVALHGCGSAAYRIGVGIVAPR